MESEDKIDIKANRRTATLALIALVLLLVAAWIYRIDVNKHATKETAPNTTSNVSSPGPSNSTATTGNTTPSTIDSLSQQIQQNPNDPNLYAQKSDLLYNSGDKAAALSAVQDGLVTNPDSDLLKSKQDVLSKDYFQSSNTDAPRQ